MAHSELYSCPSRLAEGFYTSEVPATSGGWPIRTFLPTGYEPNYPYPLVVFLHGHGGSEEQILHLAPRLSRRNYVCIALRGPHQVGPRPDGRVAFSWGAEGQADTLVEDYVLRAITQTRCAYHIHSERIYLAGFCEGATLAYRLALAAPEKFAGVISLNGTMPRGGGPLFRFPEVRELRVLIGHGIANALVPLALARSDFRLLYSAGLDVHMHTYPANHRIHPDMLRDINRWIIQQINDEHDVFRD
jgi:phospholipase/carboxylesterase